MILKYMYIIINYKLMETIFDNTLIDARRISNSSIDELQYEFECSMERAIKLRDEA